MKWIGLCLILAGCSGLGISYVGDYNRRTLKLMKLKEMVGYLADEIDMHQVSLARALQNCEKRMDGEYRSFLHAVNEKLAQFSGEDISLIWKAKVDMIKKDLKKSDYELVLHCMDQTGFLDAKSQKKALEECQKKLEEQITILVQKKEENCKLYQTIGILGGIFLCVLLI